MEPLPRISIVTPSFNQSKYIAGNIESLLAQKYPHVEHIVVDGGSTDGTLEILGRYPHLRLVVEPDRGWAGGANKGFGLATGHIWGLLDSNEALLPEALHRVAREIDPSRDRHVIMGRCRLVDDHGRFTGIEHPSRFESHRRVLQIWKGHAIPRPALFWTPDVWRRCGRMDDSLKPGWTDYDLLCRFSREYPFHFVDHVLATYRLASESTSERWTERTRLEEGISISHRYWGSPLTLMRWRLGLSLAWYRFNRVGRARRWLREAEDCGKHGRFVRAALRAVAGVVVAPEVVFYVAIFPPIRDCAAELWKRHLERLSR
jgi:glycosyltransferase involved in cell wall biosynthesis